MAELSSMSAYFEKVVEPDEELPPSTSFVDVLVVRLDRRGLRVVEDAEERVPAIRSAYEALVVDLVRERFPAEGEEPVRDVDRGIDEQVVSDHERELPLLGDELGLPEGDARDGARSVYAEIRPVRNAPV